MLKDLVKQSRSYRSFDPAVKITQEQLRRAALLKERQLSRQLAREAAKAARKERLIIIFKKPNNHQQ